MFEIYKVVNGSYYPTGRRVKTVEYAEELCAIYSDMDFGAKYVYFEIG